MKCPDCEVWTMVKDTRQLKEFATRRRYECANGHRFWTLEQVDVSKTPIRKKPKTSEISCESGLSALR